MEHSVKVCSINFFVSVRTLTVLAIKVISVKRLFSFINYTAFKEINRAVSRIEINYQMSYNKTDGSVGIIY